MGKNKVLSLGKSHVISFVSGSTGDFFFGQTVNIGHFKKNIGVNTMYAITDGAFEFLRTVLKPVWEPHCTYPTGTIGRGGAAPWQTLAQPSKQQRP